jgi:hypothetical protein
VAVAVMLVRRMRVDMLQRRMLVPVAVGARDVVGIAILPAPHQAAGLILVARQWLELHLDGAVRQRGPMILGNGILNRPARPYKPSGKARADAA